MLAGSSGGSGVGSSVATYLARLPRGLASYPQCLAKGALANKVRHALPAELDPEGFAPELRGVVRGELLDSSWYPEVHHTALMLGIREQLFDGREAPFLAWVKSSNLELFRSRLYMRLMKVLSPEQLLRRAAVNWSQFHRGTRIEPGAFREREAELRVNFPAHLVDFEVASAYASAFEAALVFNGEDDARVEVGEVTGITVSFRARW